MASMTGNNSLQPPRPLGRDLLRVALATATLLLVPLVAMQFTNELRWNAFDFVAAAILLGGTGCAYVLLARKLSRPLQRAIGGAVLALGLLLVWAQLAVGIIK